MFGLRYIIFDFDYVNGYFNGFLILNNVFGYMWLSSYYCVLFEMKIESCRLIYGLLELGVGWDYVIVVELVLDIVFKVWVLGVFSFFIISWVTLNEFLEL